jgi:hypothetical protein
MRRHSIVLHADRLLCPEGVIRLRAAAVELVERMPEIVFQRYRTPDKEARARGGGSHGRAREAGRDAHADPPGPWRWTD